MAGRRKNILILVFILGGYTTYFLINMLFSTDIHSYCVFKNVTGIPCPGCGMGRGTLELFKGNINQAFVHHPLSIPFNLAMLVSLFFVGKDIKKNESKFLNFLRKKPSGSNFLWIIILLVALWVWNIYRGV